MARKKIVAGNWKMNMTPSQAVKLVEELKPLVVSDSVDVVYCVPAIDIVPVVEAVKGTTYRLVPRTCTSKRRVHTQVRSPQRCW